MSSNRAPEINTKAPHFDYSTYVDVEVSISPESLRADGWHHESECKNAPPQPPKPLLVGASPVADAIASLHRQAHPSQHADPVLCREEPCRSLSIAQLRGEAAVA